MPMKGAKKHTDRLKKLSGRQVTQMMGAVAYEASDIIRVEAHQSISRGAVSGKGHVPSKPGEPPNRDTGDLQAGLENIQTGVLTAEVRAEAPHSAPLEFGSERKAGKAARSFAGNFTPFGPIRAKQGPVKIEFGDSTTAARPFMRPARDGKLKEIRKLLVKRTDELVKRSG